MRRAPIPYSDRELAWIEANSALPRREAHARFLETFGRTDVTLENLTSLFKRMGWHTGRSGQFAKGQAPANKGKKMPFNPKSAATRFRPGHRPHNSKPVGHERVSVEGYIEVSVAETNPHTGAGRRYVQKHRRLWEIENGPVPEGHCLKCLDGNKLNTDPSNWECIPRSMLPRLNNQWGRAYDDAAPEVKPTIMAVAKLEQTIAKVKKQ